jgi:hypothetical protein
MIRQSTRPRRKYSGQILPFPGRGSGAGQRRYGQAYACARRAPWHWQWAALCPQRSAPDARHYAAGAEVRGSRSRHVGALVHLREHSAARLRAPIDAGGIDSCSDPAFLSPRARDPSAVLFKFAADVRAD